VNLKVYDDSKNYTCQVIKLPTKVPIKGLDNLVEVNYQGNSVLIGKDSPEDELYLFFPAESQISHEFLSKNNLYRHENLNADPSQKGFFEDNRRVKAIKFRGIISSGFIIPVSSLGWGDIHDTSVLSLKIGDEFNEINGIEICRKYARKRNPGSSVKSNTKESMIEKVLDKRQAPEHMDTAQLMRNIGKLSLDTELVITYKLHGTSARTYRSLVKRKLNRREKIAKFFGAKVKEEDYDYVACSRRQVKSIGFEQLPNKNHWFVSGDLWSEVAKKEIDGKLNKGEAIYYEIIGKTYTGEVIQGGYTYGLDQPMIFVYRITNINPDGIEVDLPWNQVEERCRQLGLGTCSVFFKGTLGEFIEKYDSGQTYLEIEEPLIRIFYNKLLEKPSILDSSVVEEGFCVRIDKYPKPEIFKIKSKKFLEHESKALDKNIIDMEENQISDEEPENTDSNN
jgi:hypothetical protein